MFGSWEASIGVEKERVRRLAALIDFDTLSLSASGVDKLRIR